MEPQNETPAVRHPGETLPTVGMIITRIARIDRNGACMAADDLRTCCTVADVADLAVALLTTWRHELHPQGDNVDVGHAVDALDRINGQVDWPTFNADVARVTALVFTPPRG
jgi:hypothetical protein